MKVDLTELKKLKKRLMVRTVLAVGVESGRLTIDLMRFEEEVSRVGESIELPFGADAILAEPEKIGQEIAAQLGGAGIKERRCVLCVPANWALSATTDVPAMSAEDLRGYFELRAEREFPVSVSDLRLAHCKFAAPDGGQRATLAAVPAKRMEAIERMLAAAHCRAVSISLGLDACLSRDEMPAALHFVANGNHVDLVVAAGGGIAALRSLPAPSDAAAFDATRFSREVRITLGRLPDALRQQVQQARFSGTPATAETLCLEIRQQLSRLGIDSRVQRGDETGRASHPNVSLGAAGHYLRREPVIFEFLPPQVDRLQVAMRHLDDRRRRWLLAAALALVFLPVVTFFVRAHIESSLETEWAGMRRKVTDLDSLQQRIRRFRGWFDHTPQALQIFESVATAFPEQGDVWAKSVQVGEGYKVTITGFARSQSAILGLLDRLRSRKDVTGLQVQQVRGENPIQFSVVYKAEMHDGG